MGMALYIYRCTNFDVDEQANYCYLKSLIGITKDKDVISYFQNLFCNGLDNNAYYEVIGQDLYECLKHCRSEEFEDFVTNEIDNSCQQYYEICLSP